MPPSFPQNSAQQTMLTTWLIELYVNDLGNLRDKEQFEDYKALQDKFHQFLATPSLQVREGVRMKDGGVEGRRSGGVEE